MLPVKKIICVINSQKEQAKVEAEICQKILMASGIEVIMPEDDTCFWSIHLQDYIEDIAKKSPDLALIFGGDGTMIKAARICAEYSLPIMGFNLGHLGFLTSVELENVEYACEKIIKGELAKEERMLLLCEIYRGGKLIAMQTAINDVVMSNVGIARTISVDVEIEDEHVVGYRGDGIIVATPNGSTAYSLSAGGPIVMPNCELFVITPISPHNLYSRPIILNSEADVKVVYRSIGRGGVVTLDGQSTFEIDGGDYVIIKKNYDKATFVWIDKPRFFNNLNNKLLSRSN